MKHKWIFMRIICALLIFSFTVMTIWDFSVQLQQELTRETYRTLSEVSIDYNKAFLDRISHNIRTLNVLAGSLTKTRARSNQEMSSILQSAVEDGGFTRVVACNEKGISCANDGISIDVSSRDYFQKAMRGEVNVSEPLLSMVSGAESIVIAVPIHEESKIIGVLFGVYPLATAGSQLLDFTYYSEGYGFVVTPDGTVVLSSEHTDKLADGGNLFSFFEKTSFVNFSLEELKAAIKNGESTSFAFTYHGERRFVSFTPSTINNWVTFSIASDATMLNQEKATRQIVMKLVLKLTAAGILLLIWLLIRNRRHNREIRMANHQYQSLLSNINGGVIVATNAPDTDQIKVTYVSDGFTDMTGYTLEDIQALHQGRYLHLLPEADREQAFQKHLEQLAAGNTYRIPYRLCKKDGSLIWVMDNGYLVKDSDGLRNHSILTDITLIKQQEQALIMSEKRFSAAINASSGTLFEVDIHRQLYTHFENAERIFGVSSEKLLADTRVFSSLPFPDFVNAITDYFFHPDDHVLVIQKMQELTKSSTVSYEARLRRGDHRYIWARIDLTLSLDENGAPAFWIGYMSDIDDIKKQAELLESRVQTDAMTGLYNKVAMATLANKVLRENAHSRHALLVLDVDYFKGINDTLGHAFGDVVLMEISTKLKNLFRSNDIVGRMGGDEFAVLMKDVPDTSNVLKKATEISAAFRQTYAGEKSEYKISCSIGVLMIENNNEGFDPLYRKADAALYQAKQNGRDRFVLYQEQEASHYPVETARTNDEELLNIKESRTMEAQIFELLYTSKDFHVSINMAIAAIGQQYHVSRVAIFENEQTTYTTSNIYEWCNDDVPSVMETLQKVPIALGDDSILDCFDKNGLLYCNDVRELQPYLRSILESKGALSNLEVIIVNDDKPCGFIGFDECREYRIWTSEEIEKLSFLSKVLSVFLFKKKAEVTVLENLHTRLQILDILPDYICVVNPETHSLVYANRKMQELLPAVHPGAFCFTTLRGGQNAPCQTCLVERIKRGDIDNLEIVSEDQRLHLPVKALSIHWSNDQPMVILYGTIASE